MAAPRLPCTHGDYHQRPALLLGLPGSSCPAPPCRLSPAALGAAGRAPGPAGAQGCRSHRPPCRPGTTQPGTAPPAPQSAGRGAAAPGRPGPHLRLPRSPRRRLHRPPRTAPALRSLPGPTQLREPRAGPEAAGPGLSSRPLLPAALRGRARAAAAARGGVRSPPGAG